MMSMKQARVHEDIPVDYFPLPVFQVSNIHREDIP